MPREWRATGQALLTAAFFGAGGILGNTLSGYLYDHLGVQPMYRINASIVLAVALVALVALREPRPAQSIPGPPAAPDLPRNNRLPV